ncbi:MAG: ABC transporter permease [Pseudomonadota bacterium]
MISLERRSGGPSALMGLLSPVIAIGLTVLSGAVIFAILGMDVANALSIYFLSPFLDGYSRSELVVKAVPLALIGAGLAVSFRANVWNIGAAGQYTLGAIAGGWVALSFPDATSAFWLIPFLVAGIFGGMAWAAIPALLRTRFNSNEILVSLMLTYVAALLLDWLVRGPWRDPLGFGFPQSRDFAEAFLMPLLTPPDRLHAGVFVALVAAMALTVMMGRTIKGFEIAVIGAAPRAGVFGGFNQSRVTWFVLLLSGGLAGLAGAIEVSATVRQLQPDIAAGYGFTAIIVAFLGRLNPAGALLGALILAVSYIGGENAQILLKLPKNVAYVFQGLLLFFLLSCDTLIRYRLRLARAT